MLLGNHDGQIGFLEAGTSRTTARGKTDPDEAAICASAQMLVGLNCNSIVLFANLSTSIVNMPNDMHMD